MSNIIRTETIRNVDQGDQLQSQASTVGLTYVPTGENSSLRGMLDEAETQVILQALQHTGWNRKRAAALLKISYRGLLYKIRRHSITPPLAGD
jgi:DNA-binding NtrC family response regulator